MYYYLFGVERVGLASGYKYFGKRDWYKAGARWLLDKQGNDGKWWHGGKWGEKVSTAYALLFLIRGQQPIIVNRLEYQGDWNNRPRALASLCRWARGMFERDVNWQIVNLETPPEEWHDAPVLLLTGSTTPEFSDADIDKLRRFVHQGGTLMSMTECGGTPFKRGMAELYAKLFPAYELVPVSNDHPFHTIQRNTRGYPKLQMVHNGVRPLAIHTNQDLARSWQLSSTRTRRRDFDLMANILIYLTGRQFHNRGVTTWPDEPDRTPSGPTVTVARVKHTGNWNPEPLALERFRRMMAGQDIAKIELGEPVELDSLADCKADLAVMTGTGPMRLNESQLAAIKTYGEAGGTLVMDAACGNDGFYDSVSKALDKAFDGGLIILGDGSPVYSHPKAHIKGVLKRGLGPGVGRKGPPRLEGIRINGRPAVVLSRHDLTGGLLGLRVIDCRGYVPQSAFEIMRNLALYASAGK
jgi:hypothetical protein